MGGLAKLSTKIDYNQFIEDVVNANRAVSSLNSLLNILPNPTLLCRTFQTKEAFISTKISGMQATINEVLEYETIVGKKDSCTKTKDINNAINCRLALDTAATELKEFPFSSKLIIKIHTTLFSHEPDFVNTDNIFRDKNSKKHIEEIVKLLNSDFEKDRLVQIALIFHKYYLYHPFQTGNKRTGHLIASLFLFKNKLLSHPFLYLSDFFDKNRQQYENFLLPINNDQDRTNWIKFFLLAITTQAKNTEKIGLEVIHLHTKYLEKIAVINSVFATNLLEAIFAYPIFTTASLREHVKIDNTQTYFTLVAKFVEAGIIRESDPVKSRNKVYVFQELIELISK